MTSSLEPLPHAWPFRFADRTIARTGPGSGTVRALVSANARGVEAASRLPTHVLGELIAQAALLLARGDPGIGRSGFLAGLSDLETRRVPEPGDALLVEVRIAGVMGPIVKFDGVVREESGEVLATGSVTVRKGTPPGTAA